MSRTAPQRKTGPAVPSSAPLGIGKSHAPCEREADSTAESVLAGSRTREPWLGNKVEVAAAASPIVNDLLRSPGRPIEPTTRAFFKARFGHNFSRIRIHADRRAALSANAVNAHAYTAGTDIAFGSGHYAPGTKEGHRLIVPELAHMVEQERSGATGLLQIASGDEVNDGIHKVIDRRVLSNGEAELFFKVVRDPGQKLEWPK